MRKIGAGSSEMSNGREKTFTTSQNPTGYEGDGKQVVRLAEGGEGGGLEERSDRTVALARFTFKDEARGYCDLVLGARPGLALQSTA